jgi:enoyl-CoA hydratase/carnithine racemase
MNLLISESAGITRITLNRPERGNLLALDDLRDLAAAVRDALARDAARAIVLAAAGTDFCRGRDAPPRAETRPTALQIRANVIDPILGAYRAIHEAPVPVIAAVQGAALGFGCAIASACDVVIASDRARFSLPEMHTNLPPTLAISAHLRRVAPKMTAYLVLSQEEIDAKRAAQTGIVSAVVPHAELEQAVGKLTGTIASRLPSALRAVKEYLRSAPYMDSRGAADFGGNLLAAVLASQ